MPEIERVEILWVVFNETAQMKVETAESEIVVTDFEMAIKVIS